MGGVGSRYDAGEFCAGLDGAVLVLGGGESLGDEYRKVFRHCGRVVIELDMASSKVWFVKVYEFTSIYGGLSGPLYTHNCA